MKSQKALMDSGASDFVGPYRLRRRCEKISNNSSRFESVIPRVRAQVLHSKSQILISGFVLPCDTRGHGVRQWIGILKQLEIDNGVSLRRIAFVFVSGSWASGL